MIEKILTSSRADQLSNIVVLYYNDKEEKLFPEKNTYQMEKVAKLIVDKVFENIEIDHLNSEICQMSDNVTLNITTSDFRRSFVTFKSLYLKEVFPVFNTSISIRQDSSFNLGNMHWTTSNWGDQEINVDINNKEFLESIRQKLNTLQDYIKAKKTLIEYIESRRGRPISVIKAEMPPLSFFLKQL